MTFSLGERRDILYTTEAFSLKTEQFSLHSNVHIQKKQNQFLFLLEFLIDQIIRFARIFIIIEK